MNDITRQWLELAEEDYHLAVELLDTQTSRKWRGICFHAQQAAEKYITGVLIYRQQIVPKIHDLLTLDQLLKAEGIDLNIVPVELVELSTAAVALAHATRSMAICELIRESVLRFFHNPAKSFGGKKC